MNTELARRLAFTLGALLVLRLGTFIPLPGIDLAVWASFFRSSGRLLQVVDVSSGGAIARLSIFSLGIVPYVSAAVLIQVVGLFFRGYRALLNDGERGRRRVLAYTRAFAVVIALIQSYGVASGLSGVNGLVTWSPALFVPLATVTLAAASMFLVWLAEQITLRGLGNGIALFLCIGIVTALPRSVGEAFELQRTGVLNEARLVVLGGIVVALVAIVATMERARRRLAVTYRSSGGETRASLDFKLNGAGIVPSLMASWVIAAPLILSLLGYDRAWWDGFRLALQQGQPLYMLCFAPLVFFFVYLYTALVTDPNAMADRLARYGGTIPAIAPGEPTAEHIDSVLSRVTFLGAIYFVLICLIPEVLLYGFNLPFYLGGPSLLILVCTAIDIERQVRALTPAKAGG